MKYTLFLKSGCSDTVDTIDIITLKRDNIDIYDITINHGSSSDASSLSAQRLSSVEASSLPHIASDIDLAIRVYARMTIEASKFNHEFSSDCFYDADRNVFVELDFYS